MQKIVDISLRLVLNSRVDKLPHAFTLQKQSTLEDKAKYCINFFIKAESMYRLKPEALKEIKEMRQLDLNNPKTSQEAKNHKKSRAKNKRLFEELWKLGIGLNLIESNKENRQERFTRHVLEKSAGLIHK